jgi:glycerophosphoryl diester phosphodiesterase
MPTLSEVLATIPNGKRLFIEIKCGSEILPELKRVLKAAGKKPEQTAIIGFSNETMRDAKKEFPDLKVYWVVGLKQNKTTKAWRPTVDTMIRKAKAAKLDGLDVSAKPIINRDYVANAKQAGLGFYVWTVNSKAHAARLVSFGVDGITTDRPGWLKQRLSAGLK